MRHVAQSGFELKAFYDHDDAKDELLPPPGEFPYTRGIHKNMYRDRTWTMREYAGFATATQSNERFHTLIEHGGTGLSVAFDLPTQMGYDSDHPLARGEVGRVGVAIDSIEDMRALFSGIPLEQVSTSMTINAPASVLLLLYQLVAEEQGADPKRISGTVQNDVLKEYIARGTYIFPPEASLRLTTDVFSYCKDELPRFNTISISGYHMGEAGATPAQELAFTLSNAIEYVNAALRAGMSVDDFAPQLSFFFVSRTQLLEEVAKFRAARRMWANLMRERFGAASERSMTLRFHTQTAGVQLTAQQPEVNLARVTIAALAAVLGGTQSLHTNSYDEALALPTELAALLALRTQQVLAHETDVVHVADPLGGSFAIEALTRQVEEEATEIMDRVESLGGALRAIEAGYQKAEIETSAYAIQKEIENHERIVVGVNSFESGAGPEVASDAFVIDPRIEGEQVERLVKLRASRDNDAVRRLLDELTESATGTSNVLYPMKQSLFEGATVGEVCDALRKAWGSYRPVERF